MKPMFIAIIAALILSLLPSCTPTTSQDNAHCRIVTDLLDRKVSVPPSPQRIVCLGAGALRLYTYVGDLDKLCAVEACEKKFLISVRPYQMIHEKRFQRLPVAGMGGPTGRADAEALLEVKPDLVITTYTHDPASLDRLQKTIRVPVVAVSYGQREVLDPAIMDSLALIGRLAGTSPRAEQLIDGLHRIQDDLRRRTESIPLAQRPRTYLACQSNYGTHGFTSSTAQYPLFQAVNARNVLDEAKFQGYQKSVDRETLLKLNPDLIILDAGGLPIFLQEYRRQPTYFQALKAIQDRQIHLQLPYNAYHTNLELAYANAYFIGKVLYPQAFSDVDPAAKADDISRLFLGQPIYQRISEQLHGGYRRLSLPDYKEAP